MLRFCREGGYARPSDFLMRTATVDDIPALNELIEASVRQLQKDDYTPEQIDGAVGHTLSLDTQLIADQTYFIAEAVQAASPALPVVADGAIAESTLRRRRRGQSRNVSPRSGNRRRRNSRHLCASGVGSTRSREPHSQALRRRRLAERAGFRRLEMGSTLTGVPLYLLQGLP